VEPNARTVVRASLRGRVQTGESYKHVCQVNWSWSVETYWIRKSTSERI